jgi:hypothetical protein
MDLRGEIHKEINAILREVKSFKIDIMIAKRHNKLAIKVHDPVFVRETERLRNKQLAEEKRLWSRMNKEPLYFKDGPGQVWLKGPGMKEIRKIEELRKRKFEDLAL